MTFDPPRGLPFRTVLLGCSPALALVGVFVIVGYLYDSWFAVAVAILVDLPFSLMLFAAHRRVIRRRRWARR